MQIQHTFFFIPFPINFYFLYNQKHFFIKFNNLNYFTIFFTDKLIVSMMVISSLIQPNMNVMLLLVALKIIVLYKIIHYDHVKTYMSIEMLNQVNYNLNPIKTGYQCVHLVHWQWLQRIRHVREVKILYVVQSL